MRSFMSGFCDSHLVIGGPVNRSNLRNALSLLAMGSVLSVAPTFAKEPVQTQDKAPVTRAKGQVEPNSIPLCMEKLNLSTQQRSQMQGIINNYEESLTTVWKQFGSRYMQAIAMESQLLAAIEDNLTEPQRQQVRDARRKTAQHEKSMAATSTKVNQAAITSKEETAKPDNAAETGLEVIEVSLTPEQEALADQIQQKYHAQLRSLNRDIQGLHTRLVSLEADKLVELEKVLTKEQLAELRLIRQSAPEAPKVAVSQIDAK